MESKPVLMCAVISISLLLVTCSSKVSVDVSYDVVLVVKKGWSD